MAKVATVIDPAKEEARTGSGYPAPYAADCSNREKRALGDIAGLTHFGVNLVTLKPGTWSSQRHWHSGEDEFVYLISGELALVTDAGEQVLKAGMAAGFPAGDTNGHHLINRSGRDAVYLEVGSRVDGDVCSYPDIDLHLEPDGKGDYRFVHKDGRPY
jgi:uncharacterized cupin superfamily protein